MRASNILERLGELPSLPSVYHRAREAMDDPHGSLEVVARIIEADPALTVRVLRVANSALYGLPARVDSVLRALTVIGTAETRNLILATSIISVFQDLPLGAVSMRSFWEHSIACGIAARAIARRTGLQEAEHYYLAGLLHDIGRLPLFILEPHAMSAILLAHRDRKGHLWELEQPLFGTTHALIGAALLERWDIPAMYCSAAALHHGAPADHSWPAEAAVTHIADLIVNSLRIGTGGTRYAPWLNETAWLNTGLAVEDLPAISEVTIFATRDIVSAFLEH